MHKVHMVIFFSASLYLFTSENLLRVHPGVLQKKPSLGARQITRRVHRHAHPTRLHNGRRPLASRRRLREPPFRRRAWAFPASRPASRNLASRLRIRRCEETAYLLGLYAETTRGHVQQPAITRTCRRLRHEALPIFYQANSFEAWYDCTGFRARGIAALTSWLTAIGSGRVRIMRIRSVCGCSPTISRWAEQFRKAGLNVRIELAEVAALCGSLMPREPSHSLMVTFL